MPIYPKVFKVMYLYYEFVPRSEETRRRIIETTAVLFNKKGYKGTSLADLTAATQLTKGGIYGNFINKEDIAIAVLTIIWLQSKKI